MRVIAYDVSGSNFTQGQRMVACSDTFAKPRDIILTYSDKPTKLGSWEDFRAQGSFKLFKWNGPSMVDEVLKWMDNRFISHLDILTIFTDFEFNLSGIIEDIKNAHYQIEFIDLSGRVENGASLPDNVKVFHVGDFEHRYRLLPVS